MSATPSRVLPGLKMAGHMGAERVKIRKLEVSVVLGSVAVKLLHGSACLWQAGSPCVMHVKLCTLEVTMQTGEIYCDWR